MGRTGTIPMTSPELWMACTARFASGKSAPSSIESSRYSPSKVHIFNAVYRPSCDCDSPFWMISDDPDDIEDMKRAEANSEVVIASDWDHLTSDAYMDALKESGYDIL